MKTSIAVLLVASLAVKALPGSTLAQSPAALAEGDAARLASMWDGHYDNANLVSLQDRGAVPEKGWEVRRLKIFKRVDLPAFGKHVTYVEQYQGEPPTSLFRQRIYAHRADAATGEIVTDIYSFRGDEAEIVVGADNDPSKLAGFTPATMDKIPDACAIRWQVHGDGFVGVQDPAQCRYTPVGFTEPVRVGDRIVLTPTMMTTTTRITRDDGALASGNELGLPDQSFKGRTFTCFVIAGNPAIERGYERFDNLFIHDQGGEFNVTTTHTPPKEFRVWMLNLFSRSATGRSTLMLFVEGVNGGLERTGAFAATDAPRIAVSAPGIEANCTAAK
ncbi:MAG: CpcT/CpeT family chromophore lyase [Rhodospirillaceae bacterium]|nr:CpcT/CpeT family chromophore lyase [Rhodospirillaceae bacterium]